MNRAAATIALASLLALIPSTAGANECGGGLTDSECSAELAESTTDNGSTRVDTYEDGSGVQLVNGVPVRSFGADTFVWSCEDMGNGLCAPGARPTLPASLVVPAILASLPVTS